MEKTIGHRRASGCCRRTPSSASRPGSSSAARLRVERRQGSGRAVPDLPRRVPGPGDRQGPRARSTSATASSARCPTGRCAAARRGCTRATSTSFDDRRRKNVAVLAAAVRGGQRHRRAAADVQLRAEAGLPRLRRRARRRPRRRAHLRRGRVPDAGRTRATAPSSTPTSPATVPDDDHVPRALPPAGPEHRPARAATC